MAFGSVLTATDLELSRKILFSILDLLRCFLFQFIKNDSPVMEIVHKVHKWRVVIMNYNSIIYRKGAIKQE